MQITTCVTDADYEAWRQVRLAVVPGERCATVAELRKLDSPDRLMLLATVDGTVVGSGLADRSESAGCGFAAPRVLPEHRRQGAGSALLGVIAQHCAGLGLADLRAHAEDPGAVAFAERFGFVEVDRQVEQLRTVSDDDAPSATPEGIEIVTAAEHPGLWPSSYERFGTEVLADFALYTPLSVSAEQWAGEWLGDPMFLALADGEVVGCAGADIDADHPERAEHALTAVRRDWRHRGLATHLKLMTLQWARHHGVSELYTWTQAGNQAMIQLNERLGYRTGLVSITMSRRLPMNDRE